MSNPVIQAFFLGKALGETISEKLQDLANETLSELGKFDAQQRENLRQFTNEVMAKAARETPDQDLTFKTVYSESSEDLQETIDELRADIARLKSDLKNYQNQSL
jgi:polyhydroxyalkanoate synthesis regulator phasin